MDDEERKDDEEEHRSKKLFFTVSTPIIIIFVNMFIIIAIRYLLDRPYLQQQQQQQQLLSNASSSSFDYRKNRIDNLLLANDGRLRQQLTTFLGVFATTFCFCCCCCFCCGGQICLCFTKCHPKHWRAEEVVEETTQQQHLRRKATIAGLQSVRKATLTGIQSVRPTIATTDISYANIGFEADLDRHERLNAQRMDTITLPEIKVTDSHGRPSVTEYPAEFGNRFGKLTETYML